MGSPDQRGYNLSDKPTRVGDFAVERLANDVAELVCFVTSDAVPFLDDPFEALSVTTDPVNVVIRQLAHSPWTRSYSRDDSEVSGSLR